MEHREKRFGKWVLNMQFPLYTKYSKYKIENIKRLTLNRLTPSFVIKIDQMTGRNKSKTHRNGEFGICFCFILFYFIFFEENISNVCV